MQAGEEITQFEYSLLVHERLMTDLEAWAVRHGVPFVDVITALNQDRHYLLSWVHLHPKANKQIAARLAEKILTQL